LDAGGRRRRRAEPAVGTPSKIRMKDEIGLFILHPPSFILRRLVFMRNLLSLVIFLPLVGALLVLLFKRPPDEEEAHGHDDHSGEAAATPKSSSAANAIRYVALGFTLVTFGLSLLLWRDYDTSRSGFQFVEGPYKWIELLNV